MITRFQAVLKVFLKVIAHFKWQEADDNLTLMAIELGALPNSPESTTMSPGGFAKAKDPEVSGAQNLFALSKVSLQVEI